MIIKCIVSATNSNSSPDLYFVKVDATERQIECGWHYDTARDEADAEGYTPHLCYDENDAAGKAMLSLFNWDSASVVKCFYGLPLGSQK